MYSLEQYILVEHDAKIAGKHIDLRISIPNRSMLASFAIPKGNIPQVPGTKVLMIRTHNHGRYHLYIDNMDIPDGEYGAGTIKKLEKGNVEVIGWSDKYITLQFRNSSYFASGRYLMVKFKGKQKRDKGQQDLWIMMKLKK